MALDFLSLQLRDLDGGLSVLRLTVLAVVPSLRDRWLSHATGAEPPLTSLGSLAPGLLFLDTPRCHLQWSSSCSGSSPALWLAAMGQTAVSGKPYSCLAAGRGMSHSHRFLGRIPMAPGNRVPSQCCLCLQVYRCNGRFSGRKDAGLPVCSSTQACGCQE